MCQLAQARQWCLDTHAITTIAPTVVTLIQIERITDLTEFGLRSAHAIGSRGPESVAVGKLRGNRAVAVVRAASAFGNRNQAVCSF